MNNNICKEYKEGTIYLDDCLNRMTFIPSGSVDLIFTDLPYGTTQNKKDITIPFHLLWKEYDRILKPTGVVALFGDGLFFVDVVNSNRAKFKYDIVWDKMLTSGFLNAKKMPLRVHEKIAIFYSKKPTYNPQMTKGKPGHSRGSKVKLGFTNRNYGEIKEASDTIITEDKYPKSILSFQKPHPSKALHRTEKSLELCKWVINTYSNPGETVLDNAAGSGTAGEACIITGRKFIMIDNDPECFDLMKQRLQRYEYF